MVPAVPSQTPTPLEHPTHTYSIVSDARLRDTTSHYSHCHCRRRRQLCRRFLAVNGGGSPYTYFWNERHLAFYDLQSSVHPNSYRCHSNQIPPLVQETQASPPRPRTTDDVDQTSSDEARRRSVPSRHLPAPTPQPLTACAATSPPRMNDFGFSNPCLALQTALSRVRSPLSCSRRTPLPPLAPRG